MAINVGNKHGSRESRAIEQIDCPRCGAKAGKPCNFRPLPGRPACCDERRRANQERIRSTTPTYRVVIIQRATGEHVLSVATKLSEADANTLIIRTRHLLDTLAERGVITLAPIQIEAQRESQ